MTNPPIKRTVNPQANQLKYLSMNDLICGPYFQISHATRKNLAPLLNAEAKISMRKLILKAPALMVNTL